MANVALHFAKLVPAAEDQLEARLFLVIFQS